MLILLAVLIAAAETPNTAMAIAVCDVGRMALRDIPLINNNRTFDAYYDDADPLLAMCPKLRDEIPAGYPLADGDARARANAHVPMPGRDVRPAFIYTIGVPRISADLRTATVELGYSCTGLCGGRFIAVYARTATGWRRYGDIRMTAVS